MVLPVVMYGCESWTVKKAEHQRIDAFELWCWRRLLRVPWTARRSNQSFLKETSPGCSLEGLMLKLKLQYFGHLMWRVDSFEKTLMLGKIWGQEEKGTTEDEMVGWHHQLNGYGFGWTPELVMDREAWRIAVHGVTKSQTWLSDWTELKAFPLLLFIAGISGWLPCYSKLWLNIFCLLSFRWSSFVFHSIFFLFFVLFCFVFSLLAKVVRSSRFKEWGKRFYILMEGATF